MAIKGLVDLEAFVIGGYATPETYYQISSGEYVEHDYSALNYAFEAQTLTSSFSVSCEGTTSIESATLTSSFTVSCDGDKFDFASATLTSTSSLSASGGRIRYGESAQTSSATTSVDGNASPFVGSSSLTTTSTTSQNAIYTAASESITLNGFFTQVQLAGELIEAGTSITPRTDEYTWADFKESEFVDRSWSDWFGDAWGSEKRIILIGAGSIIKATGGYLAQGEASISTSASMPTATMTRVRDFSASPSITTTASTNGNATFGPTKEVTTSISQSTDAMRFRGVSSGGNPFEMPMGAFTTSTNGIYLMASGDSNPTITTTISSIGNVTFDLKYGQGITAAFSQSTNAIYTAGGFVSLSALYSTVQAGRIITIADPWNTITVPYELRTFVVPIETRQIVVLQETRLNKVKEETRVAEVQQETRIRKIFRGTITDTSGIPRVRSET